VKSVQKNTKAQPKAAKENLKFQGNVNNKSSKIKTTKPGDF